MNHFYSQIINSRGATLIASKLIIISVLFLFVSCSKAQLTVTNLKSDHVSNPIGLENTPKLSWQIISSEKGSNQTAFEVLVATSPEKLNEQEADLWKSGKVNSSQSVLVPYSGKELTSGQRAYWKIRIWDQNNQVSQFSDLAFWEMGLLNPSDWKGAWISAIDETDSVPPVLPAPYFRKEFEFNGKIKSARLYISGLGYYEAFINGAKVGDHVLDPGLTHYDRRVKYVTYDVSEQINSGQNAIGVVLGNGWYNAHTKTAWDFDIAPWRASPSLICQLEIIDENGERHIIKTDNSWSFSTGPIVFNGIHNGETYDARKELGQWHKANYKADPSYIADEWQAATQVNGPGGKMSPQIMPPIRVVNSLKPKSKHLLNDSTLVIDLGQNITGWANIKVKGPEGSKVRMRYGERVYEDGSLDQEELSRFIRTGETQTDIYILKGSGTESYRPSFVYHGFQYIEVTSSDPSIELLDFQGDVVHTDLQRRGYFRSSNELLNQIQENIGWSFLGNYHGYPTDCPHREKIGWTGDAQLVAEIGLYNFDLFTSYLKWMDDFVDEQQESGQVPSIIPSSGWGYHFGRTKHRERGHGPQWEGALLEVPWRIFEHSGDTTVLEKYFPSLQKYIDYLAVHSEGNLLYFGIDDHKQINPLTRPEFLSSAYYYHLTNLLSQMAGIIGENDLEKIYKDAAKEIKTAFNQRYFRKEAGSYDHGGQAPLAVALYFGLVEPSDEKRVLQELLRVIKENNGHIDGGVVGTKAVINALMEHGEGEVLYEMASKRTFPSWGYWIEEFGATTMFQNWDGSQSRNHIMFGSIGDYFYKGLGGINANMENPGFGHFIINPSFDNDLNWVEVGYESLYGNISSHWKKESGKINLEVRIPANSQAAVILPESAAKELLVDGKAPNQNQMEKISTKQGDQIKYKLPSGEYTFSMKL